MQQVGPTTYLPKPSMFLRVLKSIRCSNQNTGRSTDAAASARIMTLSKRFAGSQVNMSLAMHSAPNASQNVRLIAITAIRMIVIYTISLRWMLILNIVRIRRNRLMSSRLQIHAMTLTPVQSVLLMILMS